MTVNQAGRARDELIGRERELLAHLDAWLREAVAGRGRLALVSGDPGIGKTRLADEVARLAAAAGVSARDEASRPRVHRPTGPGG